MHAYLCLRILLTVYDVLCRVCRECAERVNCDAELIDVRALSSNGRAPASHAGGRGIDTPSVHSLQRQSDCLSRTALYTSHF